MRRVRRFRPRRIPSKAPRCGSASTPGNATSYALGRGNPFIWDSGPTFCLYSPDCVEGEFCELRLYGVLRSCAIFAAFTTISATALVGSGREKGEVKCPPKRTRL